MKTASGCTNWTDYALGAIIRHCANKVHLEDAFAYVMFRLLSRIGERGQPRQVLIRYGPQPGIRSEHRKSAPCPIPPISHQRCPVDCCGKNPSPDAEAKSAANSLHQAGAQEGDQEGSIRADEIPAQHTDHNWLELQNDIISLLHRRSTPDMPLVDLFYAVINGTGTREQRKRFGYSRCDRGRKIIYDTLLAYARSSGNRHLENLLIRFKDFKANQADPSSQRSRRKVRPAEAHDYAFSPGAGFPQLGPGCPA